MSDTFTFLPPGGGRSYDWSNDTIFVKVDAAASAGAVSLVEDNMKASFALGLHMHRSHAETFYVLEGAVDFYVVDRWFRAEPGACLHLPPGVPHAAKIAEGEGGARMLMLYQPAGFDGFLAEMAGMTEEQLADEAVMAALNEKYDIVPLGPMPPAD